jgi:hypothetical protein
MNMEDSELDIEQQIGRGAAPATKTTEVVHLRVPFAVAELHQRLGDAGLANVLRAHLTMRGMRAGSLGAWTEAQRQAVGEAVTTKLADMSCEGDVSPDWFDARNVDEVLDVIENALLVVPPAEVGDDDSPESIIACLQDDAAGLRAENDEDERAANMERAARLLTASLGVLVTLKVAHAALVELRERCAEVKRTLNADIAEGDPVHPCAGALTWPMSTAGLAISKIETLLAGKGESITWPKERHVGRRDDMSADGTLRIGLDSDNDVFVEVSGQRHGEWQSAAVEFCNGGGGGGRSPRTRAALINLMAAIEEENALEPSKAWPPRVKHAA